MSFMITVEEAHKLMVEADMIIEEGEVYTIYACGHIFLGSEDPQTVKKFPSERKKFRSCPICEEAVHLIAKYKLCSCGASQVGNTMKSSPSCRACSYKNRNTGGTTTISKSKKNGNLSDPERWDCVHRDECIDKYMGYQTVPCLNCEKYKSKMD